MEAIYHPEGRLSAELGTEYTIRDHLGNSRVNFSDLNQNGRIEFYGDRKEVIQENHYYPFGMNMEGNWAAQIGPNNKYQYNSKELNDDFGLNWNDYGARFYDVALGRWNHIDPLAEKYYEYSNYCYVINNPIRLIDPDGRTVNVAELLKSKDGLQLLVNLIDDLQSSTGLNLAYENGELVETTNFLGFMTPDFMRSGSEKAREYVRGLIKSPDEIKVSGDNKEESFATEDGHINLGYNQINTYKNSLESAGFSSQIMDFGMVFLHESLHTIAGAKVWDPNRTRGYKDPVNRISTQEEIAKAFKEGKEGDVTSRINQFRRQLKIPTRAKYVTTPGFFQINAKGKGVVDGPLK